MKIFALFAGTFLICVFSAYSHAILHSQLFWICLAVFCAALIGTAVGFAILLRKI